MRSVIDRIIADEVGRKLAVILLGDEEWQVDVPLQYLPEGVKEGDILNVRFKIDTVATERQQQRIGNLIEKLKNK